MFITIIIYYYRLRILSILKYVCSNLFYQQTNGYYERFITILRAHENPMTPP